MCPLASIVDTYGPYPYKIPSRVKTARKPRLRYDRIWDQLIERRGRQHGTRSMIEVIRMGREFGYAKLTTAVGQALEMGCADVAAIRSSPINSDTWLGNRSRSAAYPPTNVLCRP